MSLRAFWRGIRALVAVATLAASAFAADPARARPSESAPPNVLLLTVDTLRVDRLSAYGYSRPTSPHIDRLIGAGIKFMEARTVEPLTGPSLCSLVTSRYPHEHGASRNGLRMRSGLASLPKLLREHGYRTGALVANWTLKDKATGLAEHFEDYDVILNRKRWFGLVSSEAVADDVTAGAVAWLDRHARPGHAPFFLWVHYVEPHAPYRVHDRYRRALGLAEKGNLPPEDRYDTEIAEVDRSIGELLAHIEARGLDADTLIVFTADHGESLGEHSYWGHGRNLFEPTLHIPLAITWPGRLPPATVEAPALIVDVAPTIAGLVGLSSPAEFDGYDWTAALRRQVEPPADRVTRYQAHRGVVLSGHDSDLARRSGLLEVAVIERGMKEILRVKNGRLWRFDLTADRLELRDLAGHRTRPSERLQGWMEMVSTGLGDLDGQLPEPLDEESVERLRALGYTD